MSRDARLTRKFLKLKRISYLGIVPGLVLATSLVSVSPESSLALGTNDDELVISFEEPGVQEASFTDVTITVERFGNAPLCASNPCGLDFDDSDWTSDVGTFSGGFSRLAGDEKAGTAFAVENKTTTSPRERMGVVRNSGGGSNIAVLTISNQTSDLKYLGFWWGSGNTGAGANVVRFYRDGTLVADYDAGDIDDNLIAADGDFTIAQYMGNPNFCWPQTNPATRPAAVVCADSNETRPNATSSNSDAGLPLPSWVIGQPFVYVHFRLEAGFDTVEFQRSDAGGFEMDNLTVAREVPQFTDSEVASTPTFSLDATDLLLADPRDSTIEFNGVSLGGSSVDSVGVTNATICISVVDGSGSSTLVSSSNFNVTSGNVGLGVTSNTDRSRWALSGTKGTVAGNSQTIVFERTDASPVVGTDSSLWLRIGVLNGATTPAQCSSSQSNNFLEIRRLGLSGSTSVLLELEN